MYGLDYSFARPNLAVAKSQGYGFVCRYLSWLPNSKVISPGERDYILGQGLNLALNWEQDARDGLGGSSAGDAHGKEAVRQAINLGYPRGSTIYFSYDWDVTEGQQNIVNAHARAAGQHVLAAGYRMAAYGGYWVIKRLFDAGLIDDGWQAFAWSGGLWDSRAALRQIRNGVTVGGGDCDIDQAVGPLYLWNHDNPTTVALIKPSISVQEEDMLSAFKSIDNAAVYVTDGWKYRLVPDEPAYKNLIDSGLLKKPTAQFSQLDGYGWAVVLGHGESLSGFGGTPV